MSIPSLFSTQHGRVRMHFVQSLDKTTYDAHRAQALRTTP